MGLNRPVNCLSQPIYIHALVQLIQIADIIGGIKEKILAAKRAGITDIVMCRENEKDILEIPDMYLKGVTFHYVENVQDVWNFVLTKEIVDKPLDFTIPEEEKKK